MASITKWLAKPAAIAVIGCVGNRLARAPPTIACVVSINLVPYFGLPQMHCQFQQPKFRADTCPLIFNWTQKKRHVVSFLIIRKVSGRFRNFVRATWRFLLLAFVKAFHDRRAPWYQPGLIRKPLRKIGVILLHDVEHRFRGELAMIVSK